MAIDRNVTPNYANKVEGFLAAAQNPPALVSYQNEEINLSPFGYYYLGTKQNSEKDNSGNNGNSETEKNEIVEENGKKYVEIGGVKYEITENNVIKVPKEESNKKNFDVLSYIDTKIDSTNCSDMCLVTCVGSVIGLVAIVGAGAIIDLRDKKKNNNDEKGE